MNVFISWSGPASHAVAQALHQWLPKVLQSVRPWLSSADISAGARWGADMARQLEATKFGILCLTPDNLEAPWVHFEAGALSKMVESAFVCPYLVGVEPADLRGPLVQFQAVRGVREDTRRLVRAINAALGTERGLRPEQVEETFEIWWPQLEAALRAIDVSSGRQRGPIRPDRELLEEVLEIVRDLSREGHAARQRGRTARHTVDDLLRGLEQASSLIRSQPELGLEEAPELAPMDRVPAILRARTIKRKKKP